MARFGLSPNQLKLCSASMAKSDNNQMLVCGAEMLAAGAAGSVCAARPADVRQTLFRSLSSYLLGGPEIRRDRVRKKKKKLR